MIFDKEKSKILNTLTARHYANSPNLVISFDYSRLLAKTFLILYPSLENSTTELLAYVQNTVRVNHVL